MEKEKVSLTNGAKTGPMSLGKERRAEMANKKVGKYKIFLKQKQYCAISIQHLLQILARKEKEGINTRKEEGKLSSFNIHFLCIHIKSQESTDY